MFTPPRLYTKPLRDLTEDGATWGPDITWFADKILGTPLDEYQEWLVDHMFEVLTYEHAAERLLVGINPEMEENKLAELYAEPKVVGGREIPNGKLRFSKVNLLISRQAGKTHVAKIIMLYMVFRQRVGHVLNAAQDLNNAMSLWEEIIRDIEDNPKIGRKIDNIKLLNGSQTLFANDRKTLFQPVGIGPSSGRGKTVDFLFIDELRTQVKYDGVNALEATTTAVTNGMTLLASNAGGADAIVLRDYREAARRAIPGSENDVQLQTALFEWSADPMDPIDSVEGMMRANPSIGAGRVALSTIQGYLRSKTPSAFRQEHLCQFSEDIDDELEPIIDLVEWAERHVDNVKLSDRALAIEVAPETGRTKIVSAGKSAVGAHLEVAPAPEKMTVDEVVQVVKRFVDLNDPLAVALDPKTDAAAYIEPLKAAGIEITEIKYGSLGAAYRTFLSRFDDKKITHDGNPAWEQELRTTKTRSISGGRESVIERYHGEPQTLMAAVIALWALEKNAIVVPERVDVEVQKVRGTRSRTIKTPRLLSQ